MRDFLWFAGWLVAMGALFSAALRAPQFCLSRRSPVLRFAACVCALGAALAVTAFANMALTRHDTHFDFTRESVFTPAADALEVIARLDRPVSLTYFYRSDDAEGERARHIVREMARRSDLLQVTTVDPDRDPTLARTGGVKFYNAALLEAEGRRIIVRSTDETDIAIGIQRVLRVREVEICFLRGHGEYPSDNYEFHTHVEQLGGSGAGHSHGSATAVVESAGHGVGRFRRALEALGYAVREVTAAIAGAIPETCRVVIDAGPKTPYSDIETAALKAFLEAGGAALLLYDLGFQAAPAHAALLSRLGLVLRNELVSDRKLHYASDAEMVAVTAYESHPVTERMSFTFFPGVRPLQILDATGDIVVAPLFSSSPAAIAQAFPAPDHHHDSLATRREPARAQLLAAAVSGNLHPDKEQPFRVIVAGDSDFVSNSFYPYMSNNRLALAMVRWLAREEGNAPIAARIPVPPAVTLTSAQQRVLFVLLVVLLPALVVAVGAWVWWRRR